MKDKLVNYFFDSKEEYQEVEKYINVIIYVAMICIPFYTITNLIFK